MAYLLENDLAELKTELNNQNRQLTEINEAIKNNTVEEFSYYSLDEKNNVKNIILTNIKLLTSDIQEIEREILLHNINLSEKQQTRVIKAVTEIQGYKEIFTIKHIQLFDDNSIMLQVVYKSEDYPDNYLFQVHATFFVGSRGGLFCYKESNQKNKTSVKVTGKRKVFDTARSYIN